MKHPAIERLEARLQTKVRAFVRRTPLGPLYTIRADGHETIGQSTTIHMAVESFLQNLESR
jgi:hypothetical protein